MDNTPIEDQNINDSDWLDVGDGHQIYWVDWGNKDIQEPIFYIHGGPGSGFSASTFDKFDPTRQRVIFHDQRGAGRSTPFAELKNNTTDKLVADITKLKELLGFEKISLYGFSWGSTLALFYAIANPEAVNKMLIGGVYLARQQENDYLFGGGVASHFPEVWQQFKQTISADLPDNQVAKTCKQIFESDDIVKKQNLALAWTRYQASLLRLEYQAPKVEAGLVSYPYEPLAYLEAHYLLNGCFVKDNYILDNANKLSRINQIAIVQGRYDFVCPPQSAHDLFTNINSSNTTLQYVEAGHSTSDIVNRQVIKAYTTTLWP